MAKKKQKPTNEELEAQADDILKQSEHDMLVRLAENVEALRQGMETLKLPSNDPHYLERLQGVERARNEIAERITQIDVVADGAKSYLGLGSFTHGDARSLALLLSSHFEAKIRAHE